MGYVARAPLGLNLLAKLLAPWHHVQQSETEAVKCWRLAAEQGDVDAQYYLGIIYKMGKCVPQSDTEAVKWWRLAAEQEDADAQCCLRNINKEGSGVKQSD